MDSYLLELAQDLLDTGTPYKSNHLTFITYKSRIVSVGRNFEDKTHPIAKRFGYVDCMIHSELDALIKFSKKHYVLSKCRVWNVRIDRAGKIRNSRPCLRCQKLLRAFGAGKVYHTNELGVFDEFRAETSLCG